MGTGSREARTHTHARKLKRYICSIARPFYTRAPKWYVFKSISCRSVCPACVLRMPRLVSFTSSKYVRPVRGLSMCSLRRVALLCSAAVQYAYITSVYLSGDGGSADGSGVPLVWLVSSTNQLDLKTRDSCRSRGQSESGVTSG